MIKPPATEELMRDPSKLSLTNPSSGGYHLTRCVEVVGEEEDPLEKLSTDMQVRILHSALAFFA